MSKDLFVRAEEVAGALGISKPYAYKLVREMNEELKQKGFLTIPGRVSRRFFEEKFYGLRDNQLGGQKMPAYKDKAKGTWYASFYFENWIGKKEKKMKRGFKTKR